jgi:ElaB/YqjD/DUF883 family membrane-anchored ribosome-binding protein
MAADEGRQGGAGASPGERQTGTGSTDPLRGGSDAPGAGGIGAGMSGAGQPGSGTASGVGSGFSSAAAGSAGSGAGTSGFGDDAHGAREKAHEFADRAKDQAHELADRTREKAGELADEGQERAMHAAEQGRTRLADGISRLSERLEESARTLDDQGGVGVRAGTVVHRTSDALESSADYLRSHDLPMIRDDVVDQIRERPLFACGIALGAGFLLGSMGSGSDDDRSSRDRHDSERWKRYVARLERSGRLRAGHDDDGDSHSDRHDRGGRFAALRSSWDEDDDDYEDDGDSSSSMRAQLGRAVIAGVGALLSRQIQSRIAGIDE